MAEIDLTEAVRDTLDVEEIRKKENDVEILKLYERQQQLIVEEWEKEVRRARERLNEAMKERKIHEKLKEHAFEEFMLEENRKEQKEIDELVSYRFGNIKKEFN
jgi:flagellar FliJ protein